MNTKTFIHADNALARLKAEMSFEMQRAAEPVIQQAIAQAEKAIRERFGEDLRIVVRGFGGDK